MPQQHPGRLQILVVDAHCKRRLFSTKTPTDPDDVTNGAIVIHTQRLKSDPGGNLLS
ncbi:PilI type IV pilus biogenesis protein (plasmid) [Escherichia albertii]|uniref:type IV pilus biogenesis protein PilI n=1 Tax=Escherichia albertii TaxID=208962 RepID=UPI001EB0F727|nr:PilI type IV pilus biogenesis protein [Escherichia albertii]EEU2133766.1 PilI type IV pilus biogenesis protein [Escherichia coli]WDC32389.1 PilI type IV pilus biogenesis protein [Escherichia albertii]